jgi:hypothetical protein
VRIDTRQEIIIPSHMGERSRVPQAWRVSPAPRRDGRRAPPGEVVYDEFLFDRRRRMRGRLVDILV